MITCQEQKRLIQGAVGQLEIMLNCPKDNPQPERYAIVCHPNPTHGGAMTNKVVYMIGSTFNSMGVGVVKFNFRGVGKSEGVFDNGDGERDDLRAVAKWVRDTYAPTELWLGGFSFGSFVSLRTHHDLNISRLLLVAPPVQRFDFSVSDAHVSDVPTLVIQGGQDEVVSAEAVREWVQTQTPQPKLVWMEDSGHFFHAKLNDLREEILQHF
ncbi:MAG: alpha/beta fold hydrolase [Thiotrichaceae bacterium]|nr:alpha/beta fold hydrolase [Thiotrichaceae bacterium]